MTADTAFVDALAYIIALQETDPELADLLMRCALDAMEVAEDQAVIAEQHVTPSASHYRRD